MRTPGSLASSLLPTELLAEDYLVLSAVLLLPWAFGGVEVWAYRTAAALLVASAAVVLARQGLPGLGLDCDRRWLLPALLFGVWALVQIVPLPPALIQSLSPQADAIYRDTFPGYPEAAPADLAGAIRQRALVEAPEFDGQPVPERAESGRDFPVGRGWSGWKTLSLLPSAGAERLSWYLALLLGFLVVRRRCADPEVLRLYRTALFALFLALAVFGLVYAATSNEKLYWIRPTLGLARPFGPYVNPTSFAGVMEMATPWLLGCLLLNARITRGMPLSAMRSPVLAVATVLCVIAAVATASKSAALLIGAACCLLLLISVRSWWKRGLVLAGTAAAVALAIPLLSGTLLGTRVEQFLDTTGGNLGETGRMVTWKAAGDQFLDYPFTGSGFGSFRDVFPRYMPAGEAERWAQLHNDYFEVLVEGGIVAAVLLLWLIWGFWRRSLRRSGLSYDGQSNPEALGLLLGILTLSVHAAFDFNHQIPANALLFVTLAAIAVGRGDDTRGEEETPR